MEHLQLTSLPNQFRRSPSSVTAFMLNTATCQALTCGGPCTASRLCRYDPGVLLTAIGRYLPQLASGGTDALKLTGPFSKVRARSPQPITCCCAVLQWLQRSCSVRCWPYLETPAALDNGASCCSMLEGSTRLMQPLVLPSQSALFAALVASPPCHRQVCQRLELCQSSAVAWTCCLLLPPLADILAAGPPWCCPTGAGRCCY